MNEDELQKYIGHRINIMDVDDVMNGIKYVYDKVGVKNIIIHSSAWVIAYGKDAKNLRLALDSGITMSATRFRKGDDYNIDDYLYTKSISNKVESEEFCKKIEQKYRDNTCCVPCKDLNFVSKPTVVGLGDSFVGGLLLGLL